MFDVGTGSWTRILPAGDPGSDGKTQSFPIPREGAVAVSSPHALVGANPSVGADILVFGGQDAQGNYLNDLWLLRGYQAALSQTNQSWSGSGGSLGTGVDASGTGVTVQYMTSCAQALTPSSSSPGSQPTSSSPSSKSSAMPSTLSWSCKSCVVVTSVFWFGVMIFQVSEYFLLCHVGVNTM